MVAARRQETAAAAATGHQRGRAAAAAADASATASAWGNTTKRDLHYIIMYTRRKRPRNAVRMPTSNHERVRQEKIV